METLISNFPIQLSEAITIGEGAKLSLPSQNIQNVLVSGLGGSGIGGNLVAEICSDELKVPFQVNKDYFLPGFVNENSLVIISSYSGNTEETLSAFQSALENRANIVCITSGGELAGLAREKGIDLINIPGGMPPRACLGYSFTQQLFVLKHFALIGDGFVADLHKSVRLLNDQQSAIREQAKSVAGQLAGKLPIIYVENSMEAVAIRFRQQLNENAKVLCWHHVVPEMNHNELVGWRTKDDKFAVVFIKNDSDDPRNRKRMDISQQIMSEYTPNFITLESMGDTKLQRSLYLIHLVDWISFYLAKERNMDAMEVYVIDRLKGELADS